MRIRSRRTSLVNRSQHRDVRSAVINVPVIHSGHMPARRPCRLYSVSISPIRVSRSLSVNFDGLFANRRAIKRMAFCRGVLIVFRSTGPSIGSTDMNRSSPLVGVIVFIYLYYKPRTAGCQELLWNNCVNLLEQSLTTPMKTG